MARYLISFNHRDQAWAEWIDWVIRDAGHETILRPWDYQAGGTFRKMMDEAATASEHTVVVVSSFYFSARARPMDWIRAVAEDPAGVRRRVLPVRVAESDPEWLLGPIPYVNLVGSREAEARQRLLARLGRGGPPVVGPAGPTRAAGAGRPEFPAGRPALWHVPYDRNAYFTGRDELLRRLRDVLDLDRRVALTQAGPGLGGIGKTQTAVEYLYRERWNYRAIFWARADSETTLDIDLAAIAAVLELPGHDADDPAPVREMVLGWLAGHDDYLLVLDDADDPAVLERFLPPAPRGHILLMSRAAPPGFGGATIALPVLPLDESVRFLLHRSGHGRGARDEQEAAAALARDLGGVPLALEQAAAFIDVLHARFRSYHDLYEARRAHRAGHQPTASTVPHPAVACTWALNSDALRRESEAAADLILLGAFLAPERIPHELLVRGGAELGPALAGALRKAGEDPSCFDALLGPPARLGLIRRDTAASAFDLHRQVQAAVLAELAEVAPAQHGRMRSLVGSVLHAGRDARRRRVWAERAVKALARAFPPPEERALCDRLLPHALACVPWVEAEHLETAEAATLLDRVGACLAARAQEARAEPLLERALALRERALGPQHPETSASLERLAAVQDRRGQTDRAEVLYRQALTARERTLGPEHPDTATCLDRLATLLLKQRRPAQAEPLYRRALAIREKAVGPHHVATAESLAHLAHLHQTLGRHGAAEPLLLRALEIWEREAGDENPVTIRCIHRLAELYQAQARPDRAEELYRRGLTSREWTLGPDHPDTADSLDRLANLFVSQARYDQAAPLYIRSLAIREKELGPQHPDAATSLDRLATLHHAQGHFATAEPLFLRALEIRERTRGPGHPDTATSLNNLASLYDSQGRFDQAEALYRRALTIREQAQGPGHVDTAQVLNNLALLYQGREHYDQAEPLLLRALAILEQTLPADDPTLAVVLENCADLYRKQGRAEKAEELSSRATVVRQAARLAAV